MVVTSWRNAAALRGDELSECFTRKAWCLLPYELSILRRMDASNKMSGGQNIRSLFFETLRLSPSRIIGLSRYHPAHAAARIHAIPCSSGNQMNVAVHDGLSGGSADFMPTLYPSGLNRLSNNFFASSTIAQSAVFSSAVAEK